MSSRGLRLVKVDFDETENRIERALDEERVVQFIDDYQNCTIVDGIRPKTAACKMREFLRNMNAPVRFHMGWDHKIYPWFKVVEFVVDEVPVVVDEGERIEVYIRCRGCGETVYVVSAPERVMGSALNMAKNERCPFCRGLIGEEK